MRQDSLQILDAVARLLKPDGRLCVIAPGSLVRFLPQDQTVHQTLGWRRTLKLLRKRFRDRKRYGFHDPGSIFWTNAYRPMTLLGRSDLAGRYV
jgi:hypothetical protein